MIKNSLYDITRLGQSIWYDNLERSMLLNGELQCLISDDFVTGITSNPSIFMKAIREGQEYQSDIEQLASENYTAEEIFETLAVQDIQKAADLLHPVFLASTGADGYVSLEVSPLLAHDTEKTISEALRISAWVNRPNLMVKVPATQAGVRAIKSLIAAGINVNATLLFSVKVYEQVMEAYIAGLETRKAGSLADGSASVASFFVSRVDTLVDELLQGLIERTTVSVDKERLASLLGKAAIANARQAYGRYCNVFASNRYKSLAERGARKQRVLWASTSTKNPAYRDVVYIEELIAPDTVNTVPPVALDAFRDHGVAQPRLVESSPIDGVLEELERVGISMENVTAQLLDKGVTQFVDAYQQLLFVIEQRLVAVK